MRLVRQITTIGNSIGVTLPRELLESLGLKKGSFVEVRAAGMGLLLRPLRLASRVPPACPRLGQPRSSPFTPHGVRRLSPGSRECQQRLWAPQLARACFHAAARALTEGTK